MRGRINPLISGVLLVGTMSLTGCDTIEVVVPKVKQVEAVEIKNSENLATIKFDRIGIKVKRGTPVGSYDPDIIGLSGCAGMGGNVFWNQGRVLAKNIEFDDLFFEEMKAANFNVIGSPDKMFRMNADNSRNAAYLIGGQIEKIAMNACRDKSVLTGRVLGTASGKGAVTVTWQVFSIIDRKVVYETTTQGAASLGQGAPDGELIIIQNAFANAVQNFAGDTEFVKLLSEGEPSVADIKSVEGTKLLIRQLRQRTNSITETIDNTRLAVVTIESGTGHGSGFFVSPNLILTNNHVVKNSQFLRIRLLTGRKILGEVVRKHPQRDVAVVQVEAAGVPPLPIREKPLNITEEVYAIGSPLERTLSGTVTKGIVSKFARNRVGMEDIQADVDIQGGNSGGVLVDAYGNVAGVSYAGVGVTSIGLNFFIPIMDALKKLNIGFKKRDKTS